ncbi:Alcohol dehydrogenase, class IV [Sporobacter termitidis DSM 10068]|uniref:Alcohol dehydrogenase, class IV n=1 Tax=Sporobacter termitidis DSM 10068 TaxID=1123282 RepID=A0A1M5YK03_9FIRM|nr:iron-containing alcohol dehydrogenase [Sporobacter termitidis]SHI12320.1 Alcohol dehydrogenase, class IV [Sporobacter termitidis DSM 10068]
MAYHFTLPGRTVIGENALESCEPYIRGFGKKAFIVTGKIVTKTGLLKVLTGRLDAWGIAWAAFNDITGEPTDKMISAGVRAYREAGCDFIAAIGGGSPLDSAKAIGAMTVLDGKISDYMGREISGGFPPLVLIPTTAGTGSEATKFTIITDTENDVKMLLKGDALLPDLAVIDPTLTVSSPRDITAATGMDALTHAVESYTSRRANTLTDMYALDAIKRIFSWLVKAYEDGSDKRAREEMAIAAYEAGVCINNASVTVVHGMSRPIGALFHVSHGISNAMLIAECLAYVLDGCYDRFAAIARAIGAADASASDKEAAGAFLTSLVKLCGALNIPTLREYGIVKAEFDAQCDKMATDAMLSGSPSNTRKDLCRDDLIAIYKKLW